MSKLWWTGPEFLALDLPQPKWVLPGWIPGSGYTMLFAREKTGKSILAFQVCEALERGEPFLDAIPEHAWRTLYIQYDTPKSGWQDQIRKLAPDPRLSTACPEPGWLDRRADRDQMKHAIEESGAEFIVCDSLDRASSLSTSSKENAMSVERRFASVVGDRPWLLIHHSRRLSFGEIHLDTGNPRHMFSESRYWGAASSAIIMLDWDGTTSGQATLVNRDQKDRVVGLRRDQEGRWELAPAQASTITGKGIEWPS